MSSCSSLLQERANTCCRATYSKNAVTVFDHLVRGEMVCLIRGTNGRRGFAISNRTPDVWTTLPSTCGPTVPENMGFRELSALEFCHECLQGQYFATTDISATNDPTLLSRLTFNLPPIRSADIFTFGSFMSHCIITLCVCRRANVARLLPRRMHRYFKALVFVCSVPRTRKHRLLGLFVRHDDYVHQCQRHIRGQVNHFGLSVSPEMP